MCVRTKTSYGCGHVVKSTNDCYSSACVGIERYHYTKPWDCRDCKPQGANVSRGRDGEGRYAPNTKKTRTRARARSGSAEMVSAEYAVTAGAGPWAPPTTQEKQWESPHRKQADEAWLSEHDGRVSDLTYRLGKSHISDERAKPSYSRELVVANPEYRDCDGYSQEEYVPVQNTNSRKQLQYDSIRHPNSHLIRSHSHQRQDRQHSHDSLPDSIPSHQSSSKPRQASTFTAVDAYPEVTQEYDYYTSPLHHCPSKRHHHNHKRYYQEPQSSESDMYHSPRPRRYESDGDPSSAPPLAMPSPSLLVYDTYDFHSPSGSPSPPTYIYSDYSPLPPAPLRPKPYADYRRYLN